MVFAQITAEEVDFEATLNRLFPKIYYRLITSDSRVPAVRLLQKLGSEALPACKVILHGLSQEEKMKLLVYLANENSPALSEAVNTGLESHPLGRYVQVSAIKGRCRNGRLIFQAEGVQVDYRGLMEEPVVQQKLSNQLGNLGGFAQVAARAALSASPEALEKKGLALLAAEENRRKALGILEDQAKAQGFCGKLTDLKLEQGSAPVIPNPGLDPMVEEHLYSAVADFLRKALKA